MATHITKQSDLDSDKARYCLRGFTGTALANTTTNIDFEITSPMIMAGSYFFTVGSTAGDYVDFQIVDKDNILGAGAGYILSQFADNFYVNPLCTDYTKIETETVALVPQGLYMRVKYTNVNLTTAASVFINQITYTLI